MIYDCIIAGAGPAGTFCGYLLAQNGYSCLILERLNEYGEKVCGGWLPNIGLEELRASGIDIEKLYERGGIRTKSCLTVKGQNEDLYTYPDGIYGLGTTRHNLDSYLADAAMEAGVQISFGEAVNKIEYADGLYHVNGYKAKTFVAASGVRGLIREPLEIYKEQTFGISAQIQGKSGLKDDQVYFWYEDDETLDYFWAIPIGKNQWNIGMWFRYPSKEMKSYYEKGLEKYIDSCFSEYDYVIPPKGAFLGNVDLSKALNVSCFSAGDFAGTNNVKTGEGLSFALRSAKEVARQVRKVLIDEKYERIECIEMDGRHVLFLCDQIQYRPITDAESKALKRLYDGENPDDIESALELDSEAWNELLNQIKKRPMTLSPDEKTTTVRLTFNVSNCCNMACKYCYAHGGTYHSNENMMTIDVAKKALDLFYSKYDKISSIKFIGGEPAMNMDVVELICQYHQKKVDLKEIKKLPEFIFVTNGTIFNEQLVRLANQYNVKIGFSLDGPEFINDQVRVMNSGKGSSSLVTENIKKLKNATNGREPYSVNAVYTKIEADAKVSISEIIHYIQDELKVPSVHVIPVDVSADSPYDLKSNQPFIDAVDDVLNEWSDTGKEYFFNLLRGIMKKIERRVYSPDYVCDAGFGLFSISTQGNIYPCHLFTDLEEFCLGTVDEPIFESEKFKRMSKELKSYNRRLEEPCKSCFANRICIGCMGSNYFRAGDRFKPAPFICTMFKQAVQRVLMEYVKQGKDGMKNDRD